MNVNTQRRPRIETPFGTKAPERPCCYCGKPRPKGRRRWCSQACVEDFLVRKGDAQLIRRLLEKRDAEICALCGFDAKLLARVLYRISDWQARQLLKYRLGIWERQTFWDADHIVPVVEGGGGCGLENYRTLCLWCHREETARLRKRLARSRRDAARPLLQMIERPHPHASGA